MIFPQQPQPQPQSQPQSQQQRYNETTIIMRRRSARTHRKLAPVGQPLPVSADDPTPLLPHRLHAQPDTDSIRRASALIANAKPQDGEST